MKLSEAIRLGSMMTKQEHRSLVHKIGDSYVGACAWGAAGLAIGMTLNEDIGTSEIADRWPWVFEATHRPCPAQSCCTYHGQHHAVDLLIVHLNDTHQWTRERIADWVEGIENEQPSSTELTLQAMRALEKVEE